MAPRFLKYEISVSHFPNFWLIFFPWKITKCDKCDARQRESQMMWFIISSYQWTYLFICYETLLNFCLFYVEKDVKIRTLRRALCYYKRRLAFLTDQHFETDVIYTKDADNEHIKQISKSIWKKIYCKISGFYTREPYVENTINIEMFPIPNEEGFFSKSMFRHWFYKQRCFIPQLW